MMYQNEIQLFLLNPDNQFFFKKKSLLIYKIKK